MRIAIVDDNSEEASALQKLLYEISEEQDIHSVQIIVFNGTENFISDWKKENYDLIILDIFIDARTGIDVANLIRNSDHQTKLVFCSSSNEFASESYELDAAYYLIKPIRRENVLKMLKRVVPVRTENMPMVRLPDGKELFPGLILYTEYYNHVVTIYLKQEMKYSVRISQTELEQLLVGYPYFYSPIRGVLINLKEVTDHEPEQFCMSDGKQIPIARRKRKEAEDIFLSFRFQKLIEEYDN